MTIAIITSGYFCEEKSASAACKVNGKIRAGTKPLRVPAGKLSCTKTMYFFALEGSSFARVLHADESISFQFLIGTIKKKEEGEAAAMLEQNFNSSLVQLKVQNRRDCRE